MFDIHNLIVLKQCMLGVIYVLFLSEFVPVAVILLLFSARLDKFLITGSSGKLRVSLLEESDFV